MPKGAGRSCRRATWHRGLSVVAHPFFKPLFLRLVHSSHPSLPGGVALCRAVVAALERAGLSEPLSEASTSRRQVGLEPQAPGTPEWRGRTHIAPLPGAGGARPPEGPGRRSSLVPVSRQGPSSNLPLRRPRGACPRRLPRLGSRRRGPGRRRQGAAGSVPPPRAQSQLPGTGSGYSPGVSGC